MPLQLQLIISEQIIDPDSTALWLQLWDGVHWAAGNRGLLCNATVYIFQHSRHA
jgi:hypothetical protein